MVQLKKLNCIDPDISLAAQLYSEMFDQELYPSFEKLIAFSKITDADILGIYESGLFFGFMYVLKGYGFAYLLYVAILPDKQGKGSGSQALQEAIKMYSNYTCVLDTEPEGNTLCKAELFRRRKKFFTKNGFRETGHTIMYSDMACELFSTRDDMNFGRFEEFYNQINHTFGFVMNEPQESQKYPHDSSRR